MGVVNASEVTPESIGPGRSRYLTHTENLMMVVIDFDDGPTGEFDPPHSHPHEQVSYVVAGEVIFLLNGLTVLINVIALTMLIRFVRRAGSFRSS